MLLLFLEKSLDGRVSECVSTGFCPTGLELGDHCTEGHLLPDLFVVVAAAAAKKNRN